MITGKPIIVGNTKSASIKCVGEVSSTDTVYAEMENPRLPLEYQEVEYIESHGTEYISLPYGFSNTDVVRFTHCMTNSSEDDAYLISASTWNSNNNRFGMGRYSRSETGSYTAAYGGLNTSYTGLSPAVTYDYNTMYEWVYQNYAFGIPALNTSVDVSSIVFGGETTSLQIFKDYGGCRCGRVGGFTQIKNGVTVLNLIPCYRRYDNVAGLYDKVNRVFYTNQGTGAFSVGNNVYPETYRRAEWVSGPRLPSAYQEVEYIQSTGTQYINTDWIAPSSGKVYMKAHVLSNTARNYEALFGARKSSYKNNSFCFFTRFRGSNQPCFSRSGVETTGSNFIYDEIVEITAYNQTCSWTNGSSTYSVTTTGTVNDCVNPMVLFNLNTHSDTGVTPDTSYSHMKLYECKLWNDYNDSSSLTRNLIPCYRKSDNVAGLYDIVDGVFYTNSGTGTFTVGENVYPILPAEYQQVEYLQTHGTEYINTGLLFGSDAATITINTKVSTEDSSGVNLCLAGCGDTRWYGPVMFSFCNNKMEWGCNGYTAAGSYTAGTVYDYKAIFNSSTQYGYQNGTQFLEASKSYIGSSYPLMLFNFNTAGSPVADSYFKGKLYYFSISDSSGARGYFVPCYRKSDNEPGLYDTVSGTFYTNQGTGAFDVGDSVGHFLIKNVNKYGSWVISAYNDIASRERKVLIDAAEDFTLSLTRPRVPAEYQEVEYIESHGTEYINTGVNPNANYFGIDLSLMPTGFNSYNYVYCATSNWLSFEYYSNGTAYWNAGTTIYLGEHTTSIALNTLANYNVRYNNGAFSVSGSYSATSSYSGTLPTGGFIFMCSRDGDAYCKAKWYTVKIYNGSGFSLVRNFVPCYRKSDNTPGFYDTVNDVFYTNSGTGTFTVGGNV